jgi:hypothetical protein
VEGHTGNCMKSQHSKTIEPVCNEMAVYYTPGDVQAGSCNGSQI